MPTRKAAARPPSDSSAFPWGTHHQEQRGAFLMGLLRKESRKFFDAAGACVFNDVVDFDFDHTRIPHVPFYLRERVHCALALFAGDLEDVKFANQVLSKTRLTACDFSTVSMIQILIRHPDRISRKNRSRLMDHIAEQINQIQHPHAAFVGGNDNFPSMDTFIMTVGGELVGDEKAIEAGLDNLYSLRDMLGRRGFFSEYNSPTYAAVTVCVLDEIMNAARQPEARELAKLASERMWLDIAAHWHPGLSFQIGPHSRAYPDNSVCKAAMMNIVMWVTFGDPVFIGNGKELFDDAAPDPGAPVNMRPFMQAGCGGYTGTVHRIPNYIGEMVLAKTFPFRVRGTTEATSFHYGDYHRTQEGACIHVPGACADYGADSAFLTTYMEEQFGIGTATRGFLSGTQTEVFHETHKLRPAAASWADIRSVFARYLVVPQSAETRPVAQHGNGFAVQDDRRAMALYYPNGYLRRNVRSLELAVVFQESTRPANEIWIGDRPLPGGNGESAAADWVIVRDGAILLAFYPLPATNLGRQCAIRSVQENGYRLISFINYEGPARDFDMHEMQTVQNGFVFELSTLREHASPAAFLSDLRKAEICDATILEARAVRYLREGRELFLWMDPARQTLKTAAVNGKQIAYAPIEVDGVNATKLAWINSPGILHSNLGWWKRIVARTPVPGLEAVSGNRVE